MRRVLPVGLCLSVSVAACAPKRPQLAEDLPAPRQAVNVVVRGEQYRDAQMKARGLASISIVARDVQETTRTIELTEIRLLTVDGKTVRAIRPVPVGTPFVFDSVPAGTYRVWTGRIGYVVTSGIVHADSGCAVQVESYMQQILMGLGGGIPRVLTGRLTVTTCGAPPQRK